MPSSREERFEILKRFPDDLLNAFIGLLDLEREQASADLEKAACSRVDTLATVLRVSGRLQALDGLLLGCRHELEERSRH